MKKMILALLFLAIPLMAQVKTVLVLSDSISNDITKTGYVTVPNEASEVVFVIHATGEFDSDLMVVSEGWMSDDGKKAYNLQAGDSTTVTLNLADGAYGMQAATTRTDFEGANFFRVQITGAAAGNDAGDPNRVQVYAQFYK